MFPLESAQRWGKHLFGQQAENAPLDCVYWPPISGTAPLPPAADEGDPVREEIPPQTIIQSLISHSYKS